jgi:hypothetical protein
MPHIRFKLLNMMLPFLYCYLKAQIEYRLNIHQQLLTQYGAKTYIKRMN